MMSPHVEIIVVRRNVPPSWYIDMYGRHQQTGHFDENISFPRAKALRNVVCPSRKCDKNQADNEEPPAHNLQKISQSYEVDNECPQIQGDVFGRYLSDTDEPPDENVPDLSFTDK